MRMIALVDKEERDDFAALLWGNAQEAVKG